MLDKSITDYANDAIKQLATILPLYEPLANVTLEAQIEGDDLAIINLDGEDLFVEVHLKEKEVGIAHRKVLQPVYIPGYIKHFPGSYHCPPEVEDVQLLECDTVMQAACQIVSEEFYWRALNATEADAYAEVEDIFA